jgi:osmotically-inducible protein OsmY
MIDSELIRQEVTRELAYDTSVDSSQVSVTASDAGVVTLEGTVPTCMQLRAAEKAAHRVRGVSAVANELEVRPYDEAALQDTAIAEAAANALLHSATVPRNAVTLTVSQGWITLDGSVPWDYQRRGAAQAVRDLRGVRGILNRIEVRPAAVAGDVKDLVEGAFRRQALIAPHHITADVIANRVILRGSVSSWQQREAAERAAYAASGVATVENRIELRPPVHTF